MTGADLPADLDYDTWQAELRDGLLLGQRCPDCGHTSATPRQVCPDCHRRELETVELPTTGTVHSETTIEVTPAGFDAGFRVGVVDLGDARLLARLDSEADIGDEVTFSGVDTADGDPAPVFE